MRKCLVYDRHPRGIGSIGLAEVAACQQGGLHGAEISWADPAKHQVLPLRTVGNMDVIVPTAVIQRNDEGFRRGTYSRCVLHARQQLLLECHLAGRRQLEWRKVDINHQKVVLRKASIFCQEISESADE